MVIYQTECGDCIDFLLSDDFLNLSASHSDALFRINTLLVIDEANGIGARRQFDLFGCRTVAFAIHKDICRRFACNLKDAGDI